MRLVALALLLSGLIPSRAQTLEAFFEELAPEWVRGNPNLASQLDEKGTDPDGPLLTLLEALAGFDEAVGAQAAHLVQARGISLESDQIQQELSKAASATQAGFQDYLRARRESDSARAGR